MAWPQRLARAAYSALLVSLTPVYLLRLWWRGRSEPLYRHAIGERLGRYETSESAPWVWVHAVSLGETRAAAALIAALRDKRQDMRLLLTHGTATGREAGVSLLQPGDRQLWLPFDTPPAVHRFYGRFRPAVGVLMETEIWPNLLHAASSFGVPMVLANARLSERSRRKGARLGALLRPAVEHFALVLAQTPADAQRLRGGGASNVEVCGNLKFDMTPDASLLARGRQWRLLDVRPIVLAASTREGEEAMLLAAWRRSYEPAAPSHPPAQAQPEARSSSRPRLLLVPRHPQRFDEVATLITQAGFTLARRSSFGEVPDEQSLAADVWLGDSMGEMALYYAAADVALLGGSFAPLGGQNLIEAAACGTPVVMGPHTFNFEQAAEQSIARGAALRVPGIDEGVRDALALTQPHRRTPMVRQALEFAAEHRGAAQRMAQRILMVIGDR